MLNQKPFDDMTVKHKILFDKVVIATVKRT